MNSVLKAYEEFKAEKLVDKETNDREFIAGFESKLMQTQKSLPGKENMHWTYACEIKEYSAEEEVTETFIAKKMRLNQDQICKFEKPRVSD